LNAASEDKVNPDQEYPLDTLIADATLPVKGYTFEKMRKIRQAADLFFTMHFLEEAFQLYILVWRYFNQRERKAKKEPACAREMKRSAMISCARSATGRKNLLIARRLLSLELEASSGKSVGGDGLYWKFLLNMLLIDLSLGLSLPLETSMYTAAANSLLPTVTALLPKIEDGKLKVDLLTHGYLEKVYSNFQLHEQLPLDIWMSNNRVATQLDVSTRLHLPQHTSKLEDITVTTLTSISQATGCSSHGDMSLHTFLDWCCRHLEELTTIPAELQFMASESAVFYYLWRQMCIQPPGVFPSTRNRIHTVMEALVPMAEILYAFCVAITTAPSEQYGTAKASCHSSALSAAKRGVFRLKKTTEAELSAVIQKTYLQRRKGSASRQIISTTAIIFHVLDLEVNLNEPEKISRTIAKELKKTYKKPMEYSFCAEATVPPMTSTYDPSLAPSNDSSSMSSMRNLSSRIMKEFQTNKATTKRSTVTSSASWQSSGASRVSMRSPVSQLTDTLSSMQLDSDTSPRQSSSRFAVTIDDVTDDEWFV
jgi:hypothetical protein